MSRYKLPVQGLHIRAVQAQAFAFLKHRSGAVGVSRCDQRINIGDPKVAILRTRFQCFLQERKPGTRVVCGHLKDAEVVIGIRMAGLVLQDRVIEGAGRFELALPPRLFGVLECLRDIGCHRDRRISV